MPKTDHPDRTPARPAPPQRDSVLPELRTMWWETGVRARAEAGLVAVFAELPRLVRTALADQLAGRPARAPRRRRRDGRRRA